jgi:uncharacterized membrane protein YhaH (DUF805 family)
MQWYLAALRNYAVFKGRARRKEYWMYSLCNFLVMNVVAFASWLLGFTSQADRGLLVKWYAIAVLIPTIAVGVRRMHDTDHSGWWLLLPGVNLILAMQDGGYRANRFGADPKRVARPAHGSPVSPGG